MNTQPLPEWDEIEMSELGDVVGGGTPDRGIPSFWGGSVPWVTPTDITALRSKAISETSERITEDGLAASAARLLPAGAVLVTSRATLGASAIAAVPLATNQGFKNIVPNEATDSLFAYYRVQTLGSEMVRLASGTTFLEISKADFSRIRTRRPPLPEQARIARILDTVDRLIAASEAVVGKLRQVRAGLLHDLLTRGLDAEGRLRDPATHPEQFKDSPLGRIPREWEVRRLEEAADWFSGGTPSRSQPEFWRGNLPFLTPKDMKVFEISNTLEHLTEEAAVSGSRVMPPETAYIVVRGMILAHTFPVCFGLVEMPFNQDIKAIRGKGDLSTRFLAQWFAANSDTFLRKTTEATHGTKKLDLKELHATLIPVPPPSEQTRIIDLITTQDRQLAAEQSTLAKLRQLKSGLMTDLLEGRVRVPEDSRLP